MALKKVSAKKTVSGKKTSKKVLLKKTSGKSKAIKVVTKKTRKISSSRSKIKNIQELNGESLIKDSKYYSGPVVQKFIEESRFELPAGYGDNKIVLMVRDPYWLYTYWELNDKKIKEIASELGSLFNSSSLILRVYNTYDWSFFDVGVSGHLSNWYINVGRPNTSFCVDIGYLTPDGYFVCAARSNVVITPRDGMSSVIDEEWMIPDWERMYALSGGFGRGKGSFEIHEILEKRQWQVPSSWISSGSPVRKQKERPFWLVVNCELIVYGATEPTASLTVQDRPIKLREDGTFSLRFSLPDGTQKIPVEAVRDDGKDKRKITPIVNKGTE